MPSPYELALGAALADLHPRLRAYFGAIPTGAVGEGSGTFDVVGTPRRWLWPLLMLVRDARILTPAWDRDVPFRVRNVPSGGAVVAARTFQFDGGPWTMVDRIGVHRGRLVDDLGVRARVRAELAARVVDRRLELTSTRVLVRIGVVRVPIPRVVTPVVRLVESFDDDRGRQHVSLSLEVPRLGRVYEYSGWFDYAIRAGDR